MIGDSRNLAAPLVIAHRGARSLAPENTLAAARVAKRLGADGWEFDVRITKDGELVLMHDETLVRTTNVTTLFPNRSPWRVSDFTLEEIKMLNTGSWFIEKDPFGTIASGELSKEETENFQDEKMPTLGEALLLSKELGLWVNVELKGQPSSFVLAPWAKAVVVRTVTILRELSMERTVLISSFDFAMIRYLKQMAPEIRAALLVSFLPPDPVAYLQACKADLVNPRYDLVTPELLATLQNANYGVYVWTVNEITELQRFAFNPLITGIITDWPQRLLVVLGREK